MATLGKTIRMGVAATLLLAGSTVEGCTGESLKEDSRSVQKG